MKSLYLQITKGILRRIKWSIRFFFNDLRPKVQYRPDFSSRWELIKSDMKYIWS